MDLVVEIDCDDGDPGGEAAESAAKLGGRERMRHGKATLSRCAMDAEPMYHADHYEEHQVREIG